MPLLRPFQSNLMSVKPPSWRSFPSPRAYLDHLYKVFDLKSFEDWYYVKQQMVLDNGGLRFLTPYNNSLTKALIEVYPEHDWDFVTRKRAPSLYYAKMENRRTLFDNIAKKMDIKTYEDWYRVCGPLFELLTAKRCGTTI